MTEQELQSEINELICELARLKTIRNDIVSRQEISELIKKLREEIKPLSSPLVTGNVSAN